jgi:hypothetical protein
VESDEGAYSWDAEDSIRGMTEGEGRKIVGVV